MSTLFIYAEMFSYTLRDQKVGTISIYFLLLFILNGPNSIFNALLLKRINLDLQEI